VWMIDLFPVLYIIANGVGWRLAWLASQTDSVAYFTHMSSHDCGLIIQDVSRFTHWTVLIQEV